MDRRAICLAAWLLLQSSSCFAATIDEWRARRQAGNAAEGVAAAEQPPGAALLWDGHAISLPTPGWLYQDRNNVTFIVDVSHFSEGAFSPGSRNACAYSSYFCRLKGVLTVHACRDKC